MKVESDKTVSAGDARCAVLLLCAITMWALCACPAAIAAPTQGPNIVLIMLDDIGFSDTSTFGGVAQTPELDRLAARGLRYNNFHTAGICAPTRAALLSGRNQHRLGFGLFPEFPSDSPGYDTVWRKETASIAELLRRNGYSTAAFGKWHNTPFKELTPVGPFDRWPTGLGFEYFYGFLAGARSQWEPAALYRDTTPVEPKATPAQGYHLTVDLTDEAIDWVRTHRSLAAAKPYFLYFAPAAVHFPHHVPKQWADKYRGKFDTGWDRLREETFARQKRLGVIPANTRLTPRPKEFSAWSSLSLDERRLYARDMEIYAGFVEQTDHEVGRLIREIQEGPGGNDTLILYIVGDNGGSPGSLNPASVTEQLQHLDELGGPRYLNGLPRAWAWAGSTPFQWYKGIASHLGAIRNPLVVSWPARIRDVGALRTQFSHVNDVAGTLLEVAGVEFPATIAGDKQLPLDGVSFAATFTDKAVASRHRIQYFEATGNRSIYEDGWFAAAHHEDGVQGYENDHWELYHVAEDYSEASDLAKRYPQKLAHLRALFDSEARKNQVYPLHGVGPPYRPSPEIGTFVYYPGFPRINAVNAPVFSRSHRISAQLDISDAGAQGVIVSSGSRWGGFALYVQDGKLIYEARINGAPSQLITSNVPLPSGKVAVSYDFALEGERDQGSYYAHKFGTGRLYVNGRLAGQAALEMDKWWGAFWGDFGIGRAFGPAVSDAFHPPFNFTGKLEKVTVEVK